MAPDGIIRLLVARDFNVEKALEMFKKWVNWRLEFNVDSIDPNSIKHLLTKETIILHGYDLQNRFCVVVRPRFHTPGKQTLEDLIRYGIYILEQATARTEARGSKQLSIIYDRTNMTRHNQDIQVMKFTLKFVSLLQDYYAERLAMFYVIGPNWLYTIAFTAVKPFLAQKTKEKVSDCAKCYFCRLSLCIIWKNSNRFLTLSSYCLSMVAPVNISSIRTRNTRGFKKMNKIILSELYY